MSTHSRLLLGIWFLGFVAYLPGLNGGFAFDDFPNIADNASLRLSTLDVDTLLTAALSSESGPLRRPLASLSFALNYALFGSHPFSFKLTNVAFHLANGALVYWLLLLLMPRLLPASWSPQTAVRAAGLTALVWTLHPLNLTAVLYVVQRMASLATTFMLLSAIAYSKLRADVVAGTRTAVLRKWAMVIVCGLLGLACKENAAVLPLLLLVIEITAFRFVSAQRLARLATVAGLVGFLAILYLVLHPEILARNFAERPFTAGERLLTEIRILVFYLGQIIFPIPGRMNLFHADWNLSTSLWEPWTTAVAVLFWLSVLTAGWLRRQRFPLLLFAVGWYLAGHVLESTVVPLDLIYEHRNYLPGISVLSLVCAALIYWRERAPRIGNLICVGIVVILAAMTAYRAWQWSDPISLAVTEARHNPSSPRARYELGRIHYRMYLADKRPADLSAARRELEAAIGLGNEDAVPLIGLINSYLFTREPVPESLVTKLKRDLNTQLPNQRRLHAIYSNIECQMEKSCPVALDLTLGLVDAGLTNPRLTDAAKATLLEWLAVYYINVLGDVPAAERVIKDATLIRPDDWSLRLRYAEVLVAKKDWVGARAAAATFPPTLDAWHRYTQPAVARRLATLTTQLAEIH